MQAIRWSIAALAVSLCLSSAALAADSPPNVLFIPIDDLNDWVGHMGGNPQTQTPHLDALAKRGVSFLNAHCAAPACNPSRAALMSGLRPSTTGIYHNTHEWEATLPVGKTMSEQLRAQGYEALAGGKIYHGSGSAQTVERYWDDYYRRSELPAPKPSLNGLEQDHFDWGPIDVTEEEMPDYKLVTWAIEEMNKPREKPLFLAVGFVKPHLPWYAPKKYFDKFPLDQIQLPQAPADDLSDIPPIGLKMARPDGDHAKVTKAGIWREGVQAYLATISFVDDQIGRLIEGLDKSPIANNTIIVLWGDHGWHLGEKQHWRKFTLWEEATRAPLIVVAPGVGKPSLCERPVDFLCIYPTVFDLVGLPVPAHVQGTSLRPLIADPSAQWDYLALTTHGRGEHGVRNDRWRYIRYHDGTEELYDHQQDPMEWKNLASQSGHDELKQKLSTAMPQTESPDAPLAAGEGKAKNKSAKAKGGGKGKGKKAAAAAE
ncbi:MAG: sulfatase [Planctomycetota bacterium]